MGAVRSLLEGFGAGYEVTGRVMRDSELSKIARAAPVAGTDGGYSFLGKTYGAMPDETAISRDRQLAMAGVFDKHGEVQRGSELRQGVRRDEIADQGLAMQRQRFEWEKQQVQAMQEDQARVKAMNAELQQVFQNSAIGQRSRAFAEAASRGGQERAAYDAQVAAGNRGAVPPSPPTATPPSIGEALLLSAQTLAVQAKYGKATPEAFIKLADMGKQVADEGYGKALTIAQDGAPLTQVVSAFNASGQMKIDPNSIVADKMVDRNGVKSRLLTFKAPDGSMQTIDTLAELDAMGKADKIFTRTYQANADRRGAAADARGAAAAGREQARFEAEAPQRALGQQQAKLGLQSIDPNATPEQRQQARSLLTEAKGADQNAPAQVKLAQAFVAAGLKPDMRSALEFAMTAKDKSPEALKADIYKAALQANLGNAGAARKATEEAMAYLEGGAVTAPGASTRASFANEAEAAAAAKAGKIQPGDRISVGGKPATWR